MKKALVRIASILFPTKVTQYAYKKLTNPQIRKLRKHEFTTLEKADKEIYNFKNFNIQHYTWKGGDNKVLLIHGWEGQAGNFSDLIEKLLIAGYTVYSFDGPSHGFSSKGETSLFEFTELVGQMIRRNDIKNLVSHSFGGVATTYALFNDQELRIDNYVLLTTPDTFGERINDVSEMVGISEKVKNRLIEKLEKEMDITIETLKVSEFVKAIHVKNALIIHDKNDTVIPISRSKRVHHNWKNAEFKEVEGTGHFRILRTKEVLDVTIQFLNRR